MAKQTLQERTVIAQAIVEMSGDKLLIPENMTHDEAIQSIMRHKKMQEEVVAISRNFDAFPWDGAVATSKILCDKFGWVNQLSSWFQQSQLVTVEVAYGKSIQVPWGTFALPGIEGTITTGTGERYGRTVFQITAQVKRKYENQVKELLDQIQAYLRNNSIYRGKAIEIDFDQQNDYGFFEPKFLNVDVDPHGLVLPDDIRELVETEVFTPIQRAEEMAKHGISFRACVVLAGTYGTGKTLTMAIAAYWCTQHGMFFLKAKRASQLAQAIGFARYYENPNGAVVSCEDFDRVASGERTETLDDLLNVVDGVDSKTSKVFCVLTTNAVEAVNEAALRSGRVRQVIGFRPPDAKAVEALIRYYGAGIVDEDADLTEVGEALEGNIPATIADVIASSKLAMLKRAPIGTRFLTVSAESLLAAAKAKEHQTALVNRRKEVPQLPTIDQAIRNLVVEGIADAVGAMVLEGDKLVLKKEVYKFRTNGSQIKLLDN